MYIVAVLVLGICVQRMNSRCRGKIFLDISWDFNKLNLCCRQLSGKLLERRSLKNWRLVKQTDNKSERGVVNLWTSYCSLPSASGHLAARIPRSSVSRLFVHSNNIEYVEKLLKALLYFELEATDAPPARCIFYFGILLLIWICCVANQLMRYTDAERHMKTKAKDVAAVLHCDQHREDSVKKTWNFIGSLAHV